MGLKDSLDDPVSKYMSKSFAQLGPDESIANAAKAMRNSETTEAVVVSNSSPIGILTERDIVYKVVALGKDPSTSKVKDAMSSPVASVESDSKVMDAIAKMSKLGVRRLGVTEKGRLVGMVTQKAVVSGSLHESIGLPELAAPGEVRCPYCDAVMKDRTELSKHIDQVHLGLGLLEGDTSKW